MHKLSSPKTQLPYDYYSLPFCKPEEVSRQAENLGEVMSGAIIQNSPYELFMGKVRADHCSRAAGRAALWRPPAAARAWRRASPTRPCARLIARSPSSRSPAAPS